MFVEITNTPRDYAWGSETAIPDLLGSPRTGDPQAELWLGTHPSNPSRVVHPDAVGGAADLAELLRREGQPPLPFLLKVLAAERPLSLQAHPTPERAREGFERENAAGVPIDAPHRNYRDASHKPEIIVALSPTFDALCGFRPVEEVRDIVNLFVTIDSARSAPSWDVLGRLVHYLEDSQAIGRPDAEVLQRAFEWLVAGGPEVEELVSLVVLLAEMALHPAHAHMTEPYTKAVETVVRLGEEYPGDPGIVVSLLLNRVTLTAGQSLFLPAGNIHAYLSGLGIEVMASSDNVLRGGLTPKHVDVAELLEVLEFGVLPVPYLEPGHPAPGLSVFAPPVPDFELVRADLDGEAGPSSAEYEPAGGAIVLCTSGAASIAGAHGSITLVRGQAAYVSADEGSLTLAGTATLFLAAPSRTAG